MQVASESTLRLTRATSQVTSLLEIWMTKVSEQYFESARITFRSASVVHTSLHRTSGLAVVWLDRETIKLSDQWFSWKLSPQRNVSRRIFVDVVRSRGSLFKFEWETFQRMSLGWDRGRWSRISLWFIRAFLFLISDGLIAFSSSSFSRFCLVLTAPFEMCFLVSTLFSHCSHVPAACRSRMISLLFT